MAAPTTTLLQDILWYSNPILLFSCAWVMVRRGQGRVFRWFCTYLFFVGAKSYVLLAVKHYFGFYSPLYFYGSWGTRGASIALSFVVLYEVLGNVLTSGTIKVSRSTFALVSAVLVLGLMILTYSFILYPEADQFIRLVFTSERVLRFTQVGILFLFLVLTGFFGFYWGNQAFGIALGFGFYASMAILNTEVLKRTGQQGSHFFALTDVICYTISSVIWLFYALKIRKPPSLILPSDQVSRYSEPVSRIIH